MEPNQDEFCCDHDPVEIANVINLMPNEYGQITAMDLFSFKGIVGTEFGIEELDEDHCNSMVPTGPYCCDYELPAQKLPGRKFRTFNVPHTGMEDALRACDISGVRARGLTGFEYRLQTEQEEILRRSRLMRSKIDLTKEYRMLTALQGIVLDADGETEILNMWDFFGKEQHVFEMNLGDPMFCIDEWARNVKRMYHRHLVRNITFSEIVFLVDSCAFDCIVKHPGLKEKYSDCCDLWQKQREQFNKITQDRPPEFSPCPGIRFVEYYNEGCIPDLESDDLNATKPIEFMKECSGFGFPVGIGGQEMYELVVAPRQIFGEVNRQATQLYHFYNETNKKNDRMDMEVEANFLPLVKQPGGLVKLELIKPNGSGVVSMGGEAPKAPEAPVAP